jgi:hypothetical protein
MSSLPPEPIASPAESPPPRASRPSLRPPTPATKETWKDRLIAAFFALVRDPNPILLKEFRATLRTPLFVRTLYVLTGLVALLMVAIGAMFSDQEYVSPADIGQGVFQSFFTVVACVICLFVPSYSATAITSERETKTYESLVLSDMSATRIILGKFFAYFGSTVLILIAVSPVISIAFLFGGVPPLGVMVAFVSTLVLLAVAASFGIAISARVESTRMAILAAVMFLAPSLMLLVFDLALGDQARSQWSTSFGEGPFWFALALPELWKQLDAVISIVIFPLAIAGCATWFLLASAVVGIRHPGEDRSTPLKLWAAVTAPAVGLVVGGTPALLDSGSDMDVGVATTILATILGVFIGMVFANEPPLPPRARKKATTLSRLLSPIGPGAAGTTRFALVVSVIPPVVTALIFVAKAVMHGAGAMNFAPLLATVIGGASLAVCTTSIAEGMRLFVGNGLVARLLTIILFTVLILAPVSVSFVIEAANMGSADVPWMLSPVGMLGIAVRATDRASMPETDYVIPFLGACFYAFVGLVTWAGIEVFVRRAKARDAALRASHVSGG